MPTAADLMTALVPRASPEETVAGALDAFRSSPWSEVGHLYLIDNRSRLVGQVPIERLLIAPSDHTLASLRGDPPLEVQVGEEDGLQLRWSRL